MSFWSSLVLARAAKPPVVTGAALGAFVERLAATGGVVAGEGLVCQIKYGRRVDKDDRTTHVIDWDDSGTIGSVREYPWDRSETFDSFGSLFQALAADRGSIYRARVGLGALHPDIVTALTREPSKENEEGLCLASAEFRVGPVLVAGLASESEAIVGWMGLHLSGPGYFYPWAYRDGRERAEAVERVCQMAAACRAAWPVPSEAPSTRIVSARRALADLWLYDDLTLPADWLWFPSEFG